MRDQDLLKRLSDKLPDGAYLEEKEMIVVHVKKESYYNFLKMLKEEFKFDLFIDLCGVHYPARKEIEVVVHLMSTYHFNRIRVRCPLPEENPVISSIVSVWKGADWFEREAYDMLGIRFEGHPNLKRILLPEGFPDFPLRKDFPFRGKKPRHEKYSSRDKRSNEGEFWW